MNFKKIAKPEHNESNKTFTVDNLKMVKVTFTFPVWKSSSYEDICNEFEDSCLSIRDNGVIEESDMSLAELSDWNNTHNKENDWYFYHRDLEVTVKDIVDETKVAIVNKSKPKPKKKKK
jgi:hypothetical protein